MSATQASPGERPFYKYASPEATLAILRSGNVRYSSPLFFNDPFDVQAGLHIDFDLGTLHGKVLDRLQELASAPIEPAVDPEDLWGKLVLAAREHYPSHGFPRQRWELLTRPAFEQLVGVIEDTRKRYQDHWRNVLLPGVRVFCVSEDRDNLLMWAHYARDHTGCVFELWSLPEEENPLSVAQSVEYADAPLPFFTEQEWIEDLVGIRKLDSSALYRRYAYVKSRHWAYEREWRVWYPFSKSPKPYDDMPLRPSEFRALYIGCKASPEFVKEIVSLLQRSYPMIQLYQAIKREDVYALRYAEV